MRKAPTNRKIVTDYDGMRTNVPEAITGGIPPGLDSEWTLFNALLPDVAQDVRCSVPGHCLLPKSLFSVGRRRLAGWERAAVNLPAISKSPGGKEEMMHLFL